MRGLLLMMLIFVTGGAAAIWWGASTLRTSAAITAAKPIAQAEHSNTAEAVNATVATVEAPIAETPLDESAQAALPNTLTETDPSTVSPDAAASAASNQPVVDEPPPLKHTRVDPLARAEKTLEHDPFHPLALRDAARLSLEKGDHEAASIYLARLIVVDPKDQDARTQLAELAAADEAWTTVQDALQPIPESERQTPQWRMLARAYSATGQLQAAKRAWSIVQQHEPDDPGAQLEFAGILFELGEYDAARRQVAAILDHQPSSVPALNLLGAIHWRHYEDSNFSDTAARRAAVTAWQAGLNIDPAQPEVRNMLASLGERN